MISLSWEWMTMVVIKYLHGMFYLYVIYFVYLSMPVNIYMYRKIELLHKVDYDNMMRELVSVVNDTMIKLLEKRSNGIDYDLICIDHGDWDTFKRTSSKVGRLLSKHEILFYHEKHCRVIDTLSLVSIYRNAQNLTINQSPMVCSYYPCAYTNVIKLFVCYIYI